MGILLSIWFIVCCIVCYIMFPAVPFFTGILLVVVGFLKASPEGIVMGILLFAYGGWQLNKENKKANRPRCVINECNAGTDESWVAQQQEIVKSKVNLHAVEYKGPPDFYEWK